MKRIFLLSILIAALLLPAAGCSSNSSTESKGQSDAARKGTPEKAQISLSVPTEGSAAERVRRLWEQTRPRFAADARSTLSETEYQTKRHEIFSAWGDLQAQLSLLQDSPALDRSKRAVPKVLKLVEDLYGFPGNTEPERQKRRAPVKANIEKRLSDLDAEMKTL